MLKHLMFGEQAPLDEVQAWKYTRIVLAKEFPGWTLRYIDNLSFAERQNIFAVLEAQAKYGKWRREKDAGKRRRRR